MAGTQRQVLSDLVGWAGDEKVASRLLELDRRHALERIYLDVQDMGRSRMLVTSDAGTDYAVALPRGTSLADGAVLLLSSDHALVVRAIAPKILTLRARDAASALRLGYLAGHLHWKIEQDSDILVVHLDGPEDGYTARIADLLDSGRVQRFDD